MWFEVAVILSGGFAAAFVTGAAGFGDALIASAIWLQFFLPAETVPVVVSSFFVMHVVLIFLMRRELEFQYFWPFLIGGAIGVPIGASLLMIIEPATFKMVAGAGLALYGITMLVLRNLPHITAGGRLLDSFVGWIGGVLGGFAGLSGFVPGVWCTQRGWSSAQSRGVTQPFILSMHGMALGWLTYGGMVTTTTGRRFLIALPAIALGAWLGLKLYRKFDETKFRQCVFAILILAGALLLANPGGS